MAAMLTGGYSQRPGGDGHAERDDDRDDGVHGARGGMRSRRAHRPCPIPVETGSPIEIPEASTPSIDPEAETGFTAGTASVSIRGP